MINIFGRKNKQELSKKSSSLEALIRESYNSVSAAKSAKPVLDDYESYAKNAYLNTATVYFCISLIAQKATTIPIKLYTKEDDLKDRTEVKNHPILNLLEKPSANVDYFEWLERIVTFYLLGGNAIQEPNILDGVVRELNLYNPKNVDYNVTGNDKLLSYTIKDEDGKDKVYKVNQVTKSSDLLHWKNIDPLVEYKGSSSLSSARTSIDIQNTGDSHNYNTLKNQARPSGALSYRPGDGQPLSLDDEAFERLKEEINTQFSGDGNSGKPLLLEGGLEWVQMSLNAKDLDYVNSRHTTMKDICRAMKVPSSLLGIEGDTAYNNMRESKELLWENAIIPMMRRFLSHLNTELLPLFDKSEGLELGMDLSLIPDLSIKQERIWDRIRQADHLTIDEKRKMTGFEPLPDGSGNTILVSSGDMPYDLLRAGYTAGDLNELASEGATSGDTTAPKVENEAEKSLKKKTLKKAKSTTNEDYLAKLDEMTRGYDEELKEELEKVFDDFGTELEEGFKRGEEVAVAISILILQDRLANTYKPILKTVVDDFARFALNDMDDFIVDEGGFNRRVNTFLEQELNNRAEYVARTTQKIVEKKIEDGREDGLGKEEIALSLNEELRDNPERALMIAETEVHGAREFAMYEVANRVSEHYHKEWLTVGDEKVRGDHASANGQLVPAEASFIVGGESMDHPGDPSGSAKQVINCRCSMRMIKSSEVNK
jgi:HK97 family phage portal protein